MTKLDQTNNTAEEYITDTLFPEPYPTALQSALDKTLLPAQNSTIVTHQPTSQPYYIIPRPDQPTTMDTSVVPQTGKDWSVVLPEEIKEHILKYALQLTNGIHDERWPMIEKILVNALSRKGLFHMVPKLFYSNNSTVHLRFPHPDQAVDGCLSPIRYPPPAFNQWVRELNIRVPLVYSDEGFPTQWMKKLASGELGFKGLQVLAFHTPLLPYRSYNTIVRAAESDRIRFNVRKLYFFVEGHSCAWKECKERSGERACENSRMLEKLLLAPGM